LAQSNENYPVAVEILEKRFGNVQEIVDANYSQLVNLQTASNRVSSLSDLLDSTERNLRSLEVLKQNVNQDVFVSIIKLKLPEDVLLQLEVQNGVDKKWSVKALTERLREYVVVRERAAKDSRDSSDKSGSMCDLKRKLVNQHDVEKRYTGPSQVLSANISKKQVPFKRSTLKQCHFCNANHWRDECQSFKTVNERKKRIKGKCFKCLTDGHMFKDCKSNKTCVYCGAFNVHHRSLCPKRFQLSTSISSVVHEVEPTNKVSEENGLMSMNEMVMMQTALTDVINT